MAINSQENETPTQNAHPDCLQLSLLMYSKLPRELRDMIYQYLYIADKDIPVGTHHFTTYRPPNLESQNITPTRNGDSFSRSNDLATALVAGMGEGVVKEDHSVEPPKDVVLPTDYLLDPTYMSWNVAKEASEMYYSSNTFSICTINDSLRDFLYTDAALNFRPDPDSDERYSEFGVCPFDVVRTLQIRVKYEHFDVYKSHFLWGDFEREQELLMSVYSNTNALLDGPSVKIPYSATNPVRNRQIEFIIMTAFHSSVWNPEPVTDTLRRLTNILEAIRTPIYALKHDFNASITVLHHDDGCFPFPKSMTNLFSMSEEDWQYEKESLDRAMKEYKPEYYFIAPARQGDEVEVGFPCSKLNRLLKRRWACSPNVRLNPEWKVSKSAYWPRGRSSRQHRKDTRASFSAEESS